MDNVSATSAVRAWRRAFWISFVVMHIIVLIMVGQGIAALSHSATQDTDISNWVYAAGLSFIVYVYTSFVLTQEATGSFWLAIVGVWLSCVPFVNYAWFGWLLWRSRK